MSRADLPEWAASLSEGLQGFVAELGAGLAEVQVITAAQGALGWMLRGEWTKAREALEQLSPEDLDRIQAGATATAELVHQLELTRVTGAEPATPTKGHSDA